MEAEIKPKRVRDHIEDLILMIEATEGNSPMDIAEKVIALECIRHHESYKKLKEFISETY